MGQSERHPRPWTVYLIVAWGVIGAVWSLVTDPDFSVWDALSLLIGAGFTYALWIGKRWAFTLSFTLAALCVVLILGITMILFLLNTAQPPGLLWAFLSMSAWIFLLMHPATKRFVGVEAQPSSPPGTPVEER